jgi:hypothetical protein
MTKQSDAFITRRVKDVARRYRKQGYRVSVEPRADQLPAFLRGLKPDLVAEKDGDRVVVEVKTRPTLRGSNELVELSERVAREKGWRFELIVSNPAGGTSFAKPVIAELISTSVARLDAVSKAGFPDVAIVYLVSVAEALARDLGMRLQIPIEKEDFPALLRELVYRGAIDHALFHGLEQLYSLRNAVLHGEGSKARLSKKELSRTLEDLRSAIGEADAAA